MSVNACDRKPSFFRSLLGRSSGLMILLSVGLHSAIALSPLKKAPELPEQPPVESLPAITVSRLPELSPVAVPGSVESQLIEPQLIEPQPVISQPVVPQPVVPQPVVPQPVALIVPVAPVPTPQPTIAETSSDVLFETEPFETEPFETEPIETVPIEDTETETVPVETEPVETEPVETTVTENGENDPAPQFNEAEVAAMAAVWEGFLGSLQSGLSGSNLQQILNLFGQSGQEDLFFDANQQPKTSVVSHHLLEDKTPEQVFEELVKPELDGQEGFELQADGEFAGGPVYEVVQGEIVHYLNIVPLNERSGSVLIVSDRPPGA